VNIGHPSPHSGGLGAVSTGRREGSSKLDLEGTTQTNWSHPCRLRGSDITPRIFGAKTLLPGALLTKDGSPSVNSHLLA
jgi:hypothetical protein